MSIVTQEQINQIKKYAGWLKFTSLILFVYSAILIFAAVTSIFTLNLLFSFILLIIYGIVAWLYIWLGQLLFKASQKASTLTQDNAAPVLAEAMEKIGKFFKIISFIIIVSFILAVLVSLFAVFTGLELQKVFSDPELQKKLRDSSYFQASSI